MIRWHIKNSLGMFLCSLVPNKKLSSSSNIYLLSLLLDQLYLGQSFLIQSEIKDVLKMENIGTDKKEYICVYPSDNICSQINKLVSKRGRVRNTKEKHAHKIWLDPYRETWKTSLSTIMFLKWWFTKLSAGSCNIMYIRILISISFMQLSFTFNKRTYRRNYI